MQLGLDGLPSELLTIHGSDEYLVQFGPFNGNLSSIVIVDQNSGKKTFVHDVEFEGISEASSSFTSTDFASKKLRPRATQVDFNSWYEASKGVMKKHGGKLMGAVSLGLCAASVQAAIGTAGFFTAIAVANCGSAFASIVSSSMDSDGAAVVVKAGTLPGKFAETALKCAFTDKVKCIFAAAGSAAAVGSFLFTAKTRNVNIEAARTLAAFIATGGLAGTWENESVMEGINLKQSYYFGLEGGLFTLVTLQQTSQLELRSTIGIEFNYTLLPNEQLDLSYQVIQQTVRSANMADGTTNQTQIGPLSWTEYISVYGQSSPSVPNGGIFSYELSEDKTELTFLAGENSLIMKRKEEPELIIGKISI